MRLPRTIIFTDEDENATLAVFDRVVKVKNDVDYPIYKIQTFYHSISDLCRNEFGDDFEGFEKPSE